MRKQAKNLGQKILTEIFNRLDNRKFVHIFNEMSQQRAVSVLKQTAHISCNIL